MGGDGKFWYRRRGIETEAAFMELRCTLIFQSRLELTS